MKPAITEFKNEYRFLSNFAPCPNGVTFEGVNYLTAEHAYQAAKTSDVTERLFIASKPTPGQAKRAGKKVTIREDWDKIKLNVMHDILVAKFTQNEDLRQLLFETYDQELVEGNTWNDTFWGVCNGQGQNHL